MIDHIGYNFDSHQGTHGPWCFFCKKTHEMKKIYYPLIATALLFVACDNNDDPTPAPTTNPSNNEEYYTGGKLGTVFNASSYAYQQPSPACNNAGMTQAFKLGEYFFERDFTQDTNSAFSGLGPLMVRNGCLYCHPAYGHGKRQTRYKASDMGNGYLLVVFDKETNGYLTSLTGMPQTLAVAPFKAPLNEDQITIDWLAYTDDWGNKFDDGETYELIYPEVTIPASAFYVPIQSARGNLDISEVGVRLESTIGVYGTGLLDAIPDDSIKAQYAYETSVGANLNPAVWNGSDWAAMYSGLTGEKYAKRFTYAISRGPLLDGPGANAIWNITNVTRSDRQYHYMTAAYASTASKDPEVQAEFYNYFPEEKTDKGVEYDIYRYLTGKEDGKNIAKAEMSDEDYKNFMIWHRGLAVPAARNLDDEDVARGHDLFRQIGCATCHRPSWTTGTDEINDPNGMFGNNDMPRYPYQKIWPYTDMIQHRLFMQNDIRGEWCRTTPLWGRGLSRLCTGADDRMHDCRARSVLEAIMWHGNSQSDARWTVEKFRELPKPDRDAVIKFIESI